MISSAKSSHTAFSNRTEAGCSAIASEGVPLYRSCDSLEAGESPHCIAYTCPVEPGFVYRRNQKVHRIVGMCGKIVGAISETADEFFFKAL